MYDRPGDLCHVRSLALLFSLPLPPPFLHGPCRQSQHVEQGKVALMPLRSRPESVQALLQVCQLSRRQLRFLVHTWADVSPVTCACALVFSRIPSSSCTNRYSIHSE